MTREARMMSGIILITVPTIQYGGYFLVRWIFSVDLAVDQGQRLHGQPAAPEFFPCRACARGRDRDSVADLPDAGGCGRSSQLSALGGPNRSATGCDSHFLGFLFLDASTHCHRSRRSGLIDLCRSSDSCPRSGHARRGIVAVSAGELTPDSAFFDCDGTPIYAEKRLVRASRPRRESHSSQTVRDEWGTRHKFRQA